ncbi:condensation domain-containing protein, partial [Kordiimonas aquimaris]|uniref:condensation domain-containing protein n=1 Tax=Kordiimonas aquimaris TaxID=707591 RepID=UPI0021CE919D
QEVLKLERVGVHDNFFELGGDSILSIQIASRAKALDISLTVRELFEHQTIAGLVPFLKSELATLAPQDTVIGQQLLLPIQRSFLNKGLIDAHHFNQSMLVRTPVDLKQEHLRALIESLYQRHDVLRLKFNGDAEGFSSEYVPYTKELTAAALYYEDMSALSSTARLERQLASCNILQASLDLEQGPLLRVGYFDYGPEQEGRLLLVLHHLVVDGVSWRILLSDIEIAYHQLLAGEDISLALKSSSYQQWGAALSQYADTEILERERPYWLEQLSYPIGVLPGVSQGISSTDTDVIYNTTITLDAEQTGELLSECNKAYRTRINELLLSALLKAYHDWTGEHALRLRMEGHGREDIFDDMDLSETIGWFTSIYPLVLSEQPSDGFDHLIKSVKEQYRRVPRNGVGYGVLTEMVKDEELRLLDEKQDHASIVFNYMGQFDNSLNQEKAFKPSYEDKGNECSLRQAQQELIAINGVVMEGKLSFTFTSTKNRIAPEQVKAFSEAYQQALSACIKWCTQKHESNSNIKKNIPLYQKVKIVKELDEYTEYKL